MANKMTNKKALEYVLKNVSALPADVKEKLENMVSALDNKATSTKRKPTKTQEENVGLRAAIMAFLRSEPDLLVTCTDIGKKVTELDGMNNQKISALMRALVDGGEVIKTVEKGKSLFQLAKPAAVEDDPVQALPRELEI